MSKSIRKAPNKLVNSPIQTPVSLSTILFKKFLIRCSQIPSPVDSSKGLNVAFYLANLQAAEAHSQNAGEAPATNTCKPNQPPTNDTIRKLPTKMKNNLRNSIGKINCKATDQSPRSTTSSRINRSKSNRDTTSIRKQQQKWKQSPKW